MGMNKEEMAEVLDTFDAELLALSRINSPHIVKVRSIPRLCENESRSYLSHSV